MRRPLGLVEILGQLPQHGRIAIDRAHRSALGISQRRQPVIGAENVGRSVNEVEVLLLGHAGVLAAQRHAGKPLLGAMPIGRSHARHSEGRMSIAAKKRRGEAQIRLRRHKSAII